MPEETVPEVAENEQNEADRVTALEKELYRLRQEQAADATNAVEVSTRERSPVKPSDHKRPKSEYVTVEYQGVSFKVRVDAMEHIRFLDLLEHERFTTALRYLLSDEKFEEWLEKVPDADATDAHGLLDLIAEKAESKNS